MYTFLQLFHSPKRFCFKFKCSILVTYLAAVPVQFSKQEMKCKLICHVIITKKRLFKYIENFTTKKGKFSDEKIWYFSYSCSKHRSWVLVRTASARRGDSNEHPQSMFFSKIRKIMYTPVNPFYYIKVAFKGVKIILVCFRDDQLLSPHILQEVAAGVRVICTPYDFLHLYSKQQN